MRFIQYWLGRPAPAVTVEDLERFLAKAIPAGQNLEYGEPTMAPEEIERHVAGFANAWGGLLVLGVEVESELDEGGKLRRRTPTGLPGVDPTATEAFREGLAGIAPPLEGLDVRRVDLGPGAAALLLDTAPSAVGAHRAPDGAFYARRDLLTLPMAEDEVMAVAARRGRPRLIPRLAIARIAPGGGRLELRLSLENGGKAEAIRPEVTLELRGARPRTPLLVGMEAGASVRWGPLAALASRRATAVGSLTVEYEGAFGIIVEVACEGAPREAYHYIIPPGVPLEVQPLLSDDEGWEVPPSDSSDFARPWSEP